MKHHLSLSVIAMIALSACVSTPNAQTLHVEKVHQEDSVKPADSSDMLVLSKQVRANLKQDPTVVLQHILQKEMQRRSMEGGKSFDVKGLTIDKVYISDPELFALISRPDLILSTVDAYGYAIKETKSEFAHFSNFHNNEADAFRHAVWNIALAQFAVEGSLTVDITQGLGWAKTFTDAHEEGNPSPFLEKAMDLHNNRAGRLFIRDNYSQYNDIKDAVSIFRNSMSTKKVETLDQIENAGDYTLVYLEDR